MKLNLSNYLNPKSYEAPDICIFFYLLAYPTHSGSDDPKK
ncbi:hypothetical protein ADICYQ_1062 [Cyclobacterium qasimii M12-11B]|uniref:Uncharacterized protein n=1 Tax=Cyclobacterium qasimii M12-11B TaxID=641524 RepID=S7X250_9BACT|nr:hypothetical protein ADICYQ_1062 [Cyclobacterium qasimii M12-11B]